jgi:hypothetical protein
MSEPTPLASGPMSAVGETTIVPVSQPKIDPGDKKVLCSAMCKCDKAPQAGKDGQQLKQVCVSANFKALDKLLEHRSPFKQEINYDMTKNPPAPIMDSGVGTKGHAYLPGWIRKYWEPEQAVRYTPGAGLIRRPDVVIVKDPLKPPTQDNIKQIIEIKFPPDELSKNQREAYIKIAGGRGKLVKLVPGDCDCESNQPKDPHMPVEELGFAAAAAAWLAYIRTKGKTPRPPLSPFPPLVPAL